MGTSLFDPDPLEHGGLQTELKNAVVNHTWGDLEGGFGLGGQVAVKIIWKIKGNSEAKVVREGDAVVFSFKYL